MPTTGYIVNSDMSPEVKVFTDPAEVAVAFAGYLSELVASLPEIHIALSGGSTPKILFDELAGNYTQRIDWSKIHLYWGDERCVPPSHPDSNYGMTERHLISRVPIPKENIHRILGEENPEMEASRYSVLLEENLNLVGTWPVLDLVILGMGADGHTASIFPNQMHLINSDQICEVAKHPESGQPRITLTGGVINQAARVAFLVTGSEKAPKIQQILTHSGSWEDYPAGRVDPAGELSWYLDRGAAGNRN